MKSNFNLLYLAFTFLAMPVFAQEDKPETVFITVGTKPEKETKKEKKKEGKKEGNFALFWQGSFSFYDSLLDQEYKDRRNDNLNNDNEPICKICEVISAIDGIGIHNGYGVFFKSFIGISANAGIDLMPYQNLVSTPVYSTLTLSPFPLLFPKSDVELLLQASLGRTFALGRGDLSGTYQKYRISIGDHSIIQLFVEVNLYDFPIYEFGKVESFGIGISIDFLN